MHSNYQQIDVKEEPKIKENYHESTLLHKQKYYTKNSIVSECLDNTLRQPFIVVDRFLQTQKKISKYKSYLIDPLINAEKQMERNDFTETKGKNKYYRREKDNEHNNSQFSKMNNMSINNLNIDNSQKVNKQSLSITQDQQAFKQQLSDDIDECDSNISTIQIGRLQPTTNPDYFNNNSDDDMGQIFENTKRQIKKDSKRYECNDSPIKSLFTFRLKQQFPTIKSYGNNLQNNNQKDNQENYLNQYQYRWEQQQEIIQINHNDNDDNDYQGELCQKQFKQLQLTQIQQNQYINDDCIETIKNISNNIQSNTNTNNNYNVDINNSNILLNLTYSQYKSLHNNPSTYQLIKPLNNHSSYQDKSNTQQQKQYQYQQKQQRKYIKQENVFIKQYKQSTYDHQSIQRKYIIKQLLLGITQLRQIKIIINQLNSRVLQQWLQINQQQQLIEQNILQLEKQLLLRREVKQQQHKNITIKQYIQQQQYQVIIINDQQQLQQSKILQKQQAQNIQKCNSLTQLSDQQKRLSQQLILLQNQLKILTQNQIQQMQQINQSNKYKHYVNQQLYQMKQYHNIKQQQYNMMQQQNKERSNIILIQIDNLSTTYKLINSINSNIISLGILDNRQQISSINNSNMIINSNDMVILIEHIFQLEFVGLQLFNKSIISKQLISIKNMIENNRQQQQTILQLVDKLTLHYINNNHNHNEINPININRQQQHQLTINNNQLLFNIINKDTQLKQLLYNYSTKQYQQQQNQINNIINSIMQSIIQSIYGQIFDKNDQHINLDVVKFYSFIRKCTKVYYCIKLYQSYLNKLQLSINKSINKQSQCLTVNSKQPQYLSMNIMRELSQLVDMNSYHSHKVKQLLFNYTNQFIPFLINIFYRTISYAYNRQQQQTLSQTDIQQQYRQILIDALLSTIKHNNKSIQINELKYIVNKLIIR